MYPKSSGYLTLVNIEDPEIELTIKAAHFEYVDAYEDGDTDEDPSTIYRYQYVNNDAEHLIDIRVDISIQNSIIYNVAFNFYDGEEFYDIEDNQLEFSL